jgi:hypothetical protein
MSHNLSKYYAIEKYVDTGEVVGGEDSTPIEFAYYLGWLENIPYQWVKNIINLYSEEWEKKQWEVMEESEENREELIGIILCKCNHSILQDLLAHPEKYQ